MRIGLVHTVACTRQGQTLDCKRWTSLLSAAKRGGTHNAGESDIYERLVIVAILLLYYKLMILTHQ